MNVPLTISAFISSIYFKRENSRRVQLPSISRQLPPMGRSKKLDAFLQFNEYDLLNNIGKVSTEVAKAFAESEFEKYRIIQDRLFQSDFDKFSSSGLLNFEDDK